MGKYRIPILLAIFAAFFSCTAFAKFSPEAVGNEASLIQQIEQKKQLIQQLQNSNLQVEKEIDQKGTELENLLSTLPEAKTKPSEDFIREFEPKLGAVMKGIIEIDSLEESISNYLETATSQITAKNYTEGIKQLDMAAAGLKKEHDLLVKLSLTIDDVVKLIKLL